MRRRDSIPNDERWTINVELLDRAVAIYERGAGEVHIPIEQAAGTAAWILTLLAEKAAARKRVR